MCYPKYWNWVMEWNLRGLIPGQLERHLVHSKCNLQSMDRQENRDHTVVIDETLFNIFSAGEKLDKRTREKSSSVTMTNGRVLKMLVTFGINNRNNCKTLIEYKTSQFSRRPIGTAVRNTQYLMTTPDCFNLTKFNYFLNRAELGLQPRSKSVWF